MNPFIIYLPLLAALFISVQAMGGQQTEDEHRFISFGSDKNGNLLILAHPLHPQKHSRDNAGHIAAMLRQTSTIPDREVRLRATAKLLYDFSRKYKLSTRENWRSHYIAFPYTDNNSSSLHRISKGIPRNSFDKEIKQLLRELNEHNNLDLETGLQGVD